MKSIRFKLWAGMMALILIVLILLWFFQIVFLQSFYTNMRISNIENEAASIVKSYTSLKNNEFQDKLDSFALNNNLSIELIDKNQKSIYVTGTTGMGSQMPMMMRNSVRLEAVNETLKGNTVSLPVSHPRFGNKFMMIGVPVKTAEGIYGALIINLPLASVEETATILKWQLLYITLILLAASLIISFIISKSFTKPILDIKRVSETMASGDFSARVENRKQDEIGQLAETINFLGQQLSKIDNLRKDLIANVSHELRTPLSLIQGYAETIRDVSGNNQEKREKQLGIIIEETGRLSRIVDDILNLSQLNAGYVNLKNSTFSVNSMLNAITKRYEVLSEKAGIEFVCRNAGTAEIEGDEGRVEQVLYNLINNAFNYTESGGTITISAVEKLDTVRVEVTDTGSGIPDEEIPFIWDKYYKKDKTSGRKTAGTGLGLAIVKAVLDAHQATYGVESKLNIGTTFWFELNKLTN